jgi:hypothetical protein
MLAYRVHFDINELLTCSKLINASVPNTIDSARVATHFKDTKSRTFHILENHRLALLGAKKIGCNIVNISGEDLLEGKPYLVFGLLWQIIRAGLLYYVNVHEHPELLRLCGNEEVRSACIKGRSQS